MKILIAADGSVYTERMLARLASLDHWLDRANACTVVHCVEPLPLRASAYLDAEVRRLYYASEAERVFEPIRPFFQDRGIDAGFVSQVGSPAEVIATMADRDGFGLVVMGSHGRGALGGLLIGSVATKVLALGKTPVLIMR